MDKEKPVGSRATVEIKPFQPRRFGADSPAPDYDSVKSTFGALANTDRESNAHFELHPTAKKLLGIEREELSHIEDRVQAEVQERLQAIQAQAYQDGFEKGVQDGFAQSEREAHARFQPMIDRFNTLLQSCDAIKSELYNANERILIQLIYNISREVLLRDLKTDANYVKRLTAAVIEKIGAKDAVRVRVSRQDFENVEQIRDFIKGQFPELKNLQIDPSDDLALGGCKVETDLSRINASVETQLNAIESSLNES